MAEHNSLSIGDAVTHPEWHGQATTIRGFSLFHRYDTKKRRPVPDKGVRVCWLSKAMPDQDGEEEEAWMEAGLIAVPVEANP